MMSQTLGITTSKDFEIFWKPFIRVFQACGVAHYSIFRPNLHRHRLKSLLFILYFLVIFFIHELLIVLIIKRALHCENNVPESEQVQQPAKHKESALMYYMNTLSIIGGKFNL